MFLIRGNTEKVILATKHNGVYGREAFPDLFADIKMQPMTVLDCELVRKSQLLYVFDILSVNGIDYTRIGLKERKPMIRGAIDCDPEATHIIELDSFQTNEPERVEYYYNRFVDNGLEGAVVKDLYARYGTPNSWLKLKNTDTADLVILRPRETKSTRETGQVWSWELGAYDGAGKLIYVGDSNTFMKEVDPSTIKPGDVVEVRHQPTQGFTDLRNGTILRVRTDKKAEECLTEQLPWLAQS